MNNFKGVVVFRRSFVNFKAFFSVLFLKFFLGFILVFTILLSTNNALCLDLSFEWDANTEPDIAGYRVFFRQEGQNYDYSNPVWQGTGTTCTIYGLNDYTSYYFVSRAYDIYDNESVNSVELYYKAIDVPPSNLPPNTPTIISPANGETQIDMPLDIITDTFSDPNDDTHSRSQWQISEQNDFSTLVVDSISSAYLTSLPVPHMILEANHTYYARVRFYDNYSAGSQWSNIVEFATLSSNDDLNSNGIPDLNEVSDTTDVNLDGIPDNDQPDVIKCIQTMDGSEYFGLEKNSNAINEIESMEIIDPETISDTANRPDDLIFGLISYRLRVEHPGDIVSVRIYFSGEIFGSDVYYKYDRINGWFDYSAHSTYADDGKSVILELKDGGFGDSDGIANGVIVDPGGLAAMFDDGITSSQSGGGSGCFIATAAFGSKFEKHVQLLRRFRDLYLMPNSIGRSFVSTYYRYSPPIADFIAGHDTLRRMIRWSLAPLILLSWMLLHLGLFPTLLLIMFISSGILLFFKRSISKGCTRRSIMPFHR